MTKIEWVKNKDGSRGETWNVILGCSIVSPGCTNCYAMRQSPRTDSLSVGCPTRGTVAGKLTKSSNSGPVWTGELRFVERRLLDPLKRKKPTTYFVNSMGDLFHEDVPDEWIDQVFAVMALCPQHTFQVLTKRAERMRDYVLGMSNRHTPDGNMQISPQVVLTEVAMRGRMLRNPATDAMWMLMDRWPLPNVWLGVSTERQKEADERIPLLLQTPAAVRFISAEPLLGHIALHALNLGTARPSDALRGVQCEPDDGPDGYRNEPMNKLDWVIVGGESGRDARPMHPEWVRSIRDWCFAAGIPFFFKQWGGWKDGSDFAADAMCVTTDGRVIRPTPDAMYVADAVSPLMRLQPTLMRKVGKKAAGRLLDGITHDAMPSPPDHIIKPPARRATGE